ncbi:MAG: class I SAM-dependent methyltransferase [Anaerolineales bacterium]|nr:class I SAM-dependent methyltransferase [Anaerolineales bacterium]
MDIIQKAISKVTGGKVLDVATQEGHFVQLLMKNLQSYTQIVGIDIDQEAIKKAQENIREANIHFLVMNAEQMDFANESFDTVSISASFHHLPNIQQVLAEINRVLKSGGNFILAEMHRDGQTDAELTSVYLHHWIGDVDAVLGRVHNHTLGRQELVAFVESLGLKQVEYYDVFDRETNPMEKVNIEQLDKLIDRGTQRAEAAATYEELRKRGDELRQRLYKIGARSEPRLIVIGKK